MTPESLLFRCPDLTPTEVLCITALISFDWDGTGSYPCNETLMDACRITNLNSMSRLLAGLRKKGYIRIDLVDQTRSNRSGRVIRLTLPAAPIYDGPRLRIADSEQKDPPRQRGETPRASAEGPPAPARTEVDSGTDSEKKTTTTSFRTREGTEHTHRSLLFSSKVSRKTGEKIRKRPDPKPSEPPSVQARPLDAPRSDPGAAPLKPVAQALNSAIDRLADRAEHAAPEPPPATPASPRASKPDPGSPERRRLHQWIEDYDADLIVRADLFELVREMLGILKRNRPIEGVKMDPYEQVRLALQDAAAVEEAGGLDRSIGVYARGTIKKRIGPGGYVPLIDPALKLDADAKEREAEDVRKRLAAEAKARAEAEIRERDAALEDRYQSLPAAFREHLEADIQFKYPDLIRWPNMLRVQYIAAMVAMDWQPPEDFTADHPNPRLDPVADPPQPAAALVPEAPPQPAAPAISRPVFAPVAPVLPESRESFDARRARARAFFESRRGQESPPKPPPDEPEPPPAKEPESFGRPRPKPRPRRAKRTARRSP